jgi:hypothetical protein
MRPGRIFFSFITLCVLIVLASNSFGQQITLKTGIFSFFDNREYFNYYENDQTIFGTRVFANTTLSVNDKSELCIGVDGLYEFGAKFNADYIKPIAYIHHKGDPIDLYFGSFYRDPIINMPKLLLNDTLQYYKPNVEGIYLAYNNKNIKHNIWIDWVSRQSKVDKEIFYIGGSGSVTYKYWFYKHDFIFTHYALTSNAYSNEHIRDNGGIYSRLGYEKKSFLIFDSISFSIGGVISYDRTRNITPLRYYKGIMTEIGLYYKAIGVHCSNYTGNGQLIITGDPLYKAKFYNRVDLIWRIFNHPGIEGAVEFSVHFINDIIDYSQKFTLRADLDYKTQLNQRKY